jgi:hypothetical protein
MQGRGESRRRAGSRRGGGNAMAERSSSPTLVQEAGGVGVRWRQAVRARRNAGGENWVCPGAGRQPAPAAGVE